MAFDIDSIKNSLCLAPLIYNCITFDVTSPKSPIITHYSPLLYPQTSPFLLEQRITHTKGSLCAEKKP